MWSPLASVFVCGMLVAQPAEGPAPAETVVPKPETAAPEPEAVPEPEPEPGAPAPVQKPTAVSKPSAAPTPDPTPPPAVEPTLASAAAPTPAPRQPAVGDAVWDALVGRQVVIETQGGGGLEGEVLESKGDSVVLVRADGSVVTTPKAAATGVRVVRPPAAAQPPPAADPAPQMAALDPAPKDDAGEPAEDEDEDEELTAGEKRRKERREGREHALLGAFAMQGATYTHWRGDGVNSGHASYAMDWGVGFNFSKTFGLYAIAGGLLGAKIDSGETKANYGRVGGVFAFGGKWYYSTIGVGAAFSRLRFADDTLQKDKGIAFPSRLMARVPLPKKLKKLYVGIGITYELALVRNFGMAINGIGGQLVFGRW